MCYIDNKKYVRGDFNFRIKFEVCTMTPFIIFIYLSGFYVVSCHVGGNCWPYNGAIVEAFGNFLTLLVACCVVGNKNGHYKMR